MSKRTAHEAGIDGDQKESAAVVAFGTPTHNITPYENEWLIPLCVVQSITRTSAGLSNMLIVDDEEVDALRQVPVVPVRHAAAVQAGDMIMYSATAGGRVQTKAETRAGIVQHVFVCAGDATEASANIQGSNAEETVMVRVHEFWYPDQLPRQTNGVSCADVQRSDGLILTDCQSVVPAMSIVSVEPQTNLCDSVMWLYTSATRTITRLGSPVDTTLAPAVHKMHIERVFARDIKQGRYDRVELQQRLDKFHDMLCAHPRRRWHTTMGRWLWKMRIHSFLTEFGPHTNQTNVQRLMGRLVTTPDYVPRDGAVLVGVQFTASIDCARNNPCGLCGRSGAEILSHRIMLDTIADAPATVVSHAGCFGQALSAFHMVQGIVQWSRQLADMDAGASAQNNSDTRQELLLALFKQFCSLEKESDDCFARRRNQKLP